MHPGTILRCCNWALSHNVVLPAWMQHGQHCTLNLGVARDRRRPWACAHGLRKTMSTRGHKWVEIDALVLANERSPIARYVTHIAIYRPRQLAQAA